MRSGSDHARGLPDKGPWGPSLKHVLHLPHDIPATFLESHLTLAEQERVQEILHRRILDRKPAAYLTGKARFAGLEFFVNEQVLVPRSPIAELIEQGFAPWVDGERVTAILDLCSGSGCIGIACAYAFPEARVDLVELSPTAMEVAQRNLENHHLQERAEVIQSDLFGNVKGRHYDIIVSNPPYVNHDELADLPREYRWEPQLGLDGGSDGLDLVEQILCQADRYLTPDGILVMEVGNSETALIERYPNVPFVWLDFEHGGHGVFLLTKSQLGHFHCQFERG